MKIAAYPHMKKENQEKFHREMHRMAYPRANAEMLTTTELANRLKAALNG